MGADRSKTARCQAVIGEQYGEPVVCGAVEAIHGWALGMVDGHDFQVEASTSPWGVPLAPQDQGHPLPCVICAAVAGDPAFVRCPFCQQGGAGLRRSREAEAPSQFGSDVQVDS